METGELSPSLTQQVKCLEEKSDVTIICKHTRKQTHAKKKGILKLRSKWKLEKKKIKSLAPRG